MLRPWLWGLRAEEGQWAAFSGLRSPFPSLFLILPRSGVGQGGAGGLGGGVGLPGPVLS